LHSVVAKRPDFVPLLLNEPPLRTEAAFLCYCVAVHLE